MPPSVDQDSLHFNVLQLRHTCCRPLVPKSTPAASLIGKPYLVHYNPPQPPTPPHPAPLASSATASLAMQPYAVAASPTLTSHRAAPWLASPAHSITESVVKCVLVYFFKLNAVFNFHLKKSGSKQKF